MKRAPLARVTPLRRAPSATITPIRGRRPLARVVPLRPRSTKTEARHRERRAMLTALFPARPLCAAPGCNRWADDAHEPEFRSRLGSITDPANVLPVCRGCHNWIHGHPLEARELGLAVNSWDGDGGGDAA